MASILSAHEIGEGLPVLIIHGWELSGRAEELDFEPIFNKTPGLLRIYVDLPGMGTTPANNVKDLDEIYLRLVEFIDSRIGKSRFLVVGSSCGGYLARAIAQKYNDQLDGLLLRVPLIEPKDSMSSDVSGLPELLAPYKVCPCDARHSSIRSIQSRTRASKRPVSSMGSPCVPRSRTT